MSKKSIVVFLLTLLSTVCFGFLVACGGDPEPVKPALTGPTELTLVENYAATATQAYTVSGTVTKTSGDEKITWNDATKKLEIAAGLAPGTYVVVLTAGNGDAEQDVSLQAARELPSIDGEKSLALQVGYAAISTTAYEIKGTNVTVTKTSGDEKITWNDSTKKLDIAAGLAAGTYDVVLTASNGNAAEDATLTFTFVVWEPVVFEGPSTHRLWSGYESASLEYVLIGTDAAVVKESGDEKIAWDADSNSVRIAPGLAAGKYPVTLKASGAYGPEQVLTLTVFVTFRDNDLPENVLASFDREEYVYNADYASTWIARPYQKAEIVDDAAAPHRKALKISYTEGEAVDEACVEIYLAEPVLRSRIKALSFTFRVENFSVRDNLFNALIYKDRTTPWGVPSKLIIATEQYVSYRVDDAGVLNTMTDSDGYIRSVHLETFGGTQARYLYIAEISCEKGPYTDEMLSGTALGTFDHEEYVYNVGTASVVFPDFSPEADVSVVDGALKISYENQRGEIWTRIYFGKAVRRSEISALKLTIRLENNVCLSGTDIALIFFGNTAEWAIPGSYTHPAPQEGVYTITDAGALDAMTDEDGFIRSVALVSFGGSQTLYIDHIEYVAK